MFENPFATPARRVRCFHYLEWALLGIDIKHRTELVASQETTFAMGSHADYSAALIGMREALYEPI
jgi:hypothetical protein